MAKANESELANLHCLLARVLAAQVGEEVEEYDEEGVPTGKVYTATPALLTIAARFLKDNEITCEVEDSEGLSDLRSELAARKTGRRKLASVSPISKEQEAMSG